MDVPQTDAQTTGFPAGKVSYQEYLQHELEAWTEWVDGEIVFLPMASAGHQKLVLFLSALLLRYVEEHQLGEVYLEPFQMKTGSGLPGRSPDVLFIAQQNLNRREEQCLWGPADLVVEIVSPDSIRRDRIEKFGEYQEGGVPEYWLIDRLEQKAEFFSRSKEGLYHPLPIREGIVHSRVLPGLWLKPEWLWQNPLPTQKNILRHWNLV
ncbi:MAG: Uma2 family endonuclease [Acidobacteriota bacterium]